MLLRLGVGGGHAIAVLRWFVSQFGVTKSIQEQADKESRNSQDGRHDNVDQTQAVLLSRTGDVFRSRRFSVSTGHWYKGSGLDGVG